MGGGGGGGGGSAVTNQKIYNHFLDNLLHLTSISEIKTASAWTALLPFNLIHSRTLIPRRINDFPGGLRLNVNEACTCIYVNSMHKPPVHVEVRKQVRLDNDEFSIVEDYMCRNQYTNSISKGDKAMPIQNVKLERRRSCTRMRKGGRFVLEL